MFFVDDSRGAVVGAEEPGHKPAMAPVGETGEGEDDTAQGAAQGHGAYISEPEGSGPLAVPCVGLVDALKPRRADVTALAARSIISRRSLTWRALATSSGRCSGRRSSPVSGVGRRPAHLSKKAWTSARHQAVAYGLEALGRWQDAKPLASSVKLTRLLRAWRLAHSWPFNDTFAGQGK